MSIDRSVDFMRILIADMEDQDDDLPGRGFGPPLGKMAGKVINVPVDVLRDSISDVSRQVNSLLEQLPREETKAKLEQITFGLQINATGGLNWVINAGGTAQSAITLTFKVR